MTVVAMCSLKGAPGTTTLATLVASAWPAIEPVAVIEADPAGGDLAARFQLSSTTGWPSLRSAARRSDGPPSISAHLQVLPGGLAVLVGARGDDRCAADSPESDAVCSNPDGADGSHLTVVDLGRVALSDRVTASWMRRADLSLLVVRGDRSTAVQVRAHADALLASSAGRLALVVVGDDRYGSGELAEFTGIAPLGEVPWDAAAARVASGESGAARRLEHSLLWDGSGRLARALYARLTAGVLDGSPSTGDTAPDGAFAGAFAGTPAAAPAEAVDWASPTGDGTAPAGALRAVAAVGSDGGAGARVGRGRSSGATPDAATPDAAAWRNGSFRALAGRVRTGPLVSGGRRARLTGSGQRLPGAGR
jgi:hypothetical protein